MLVPMSRLNTWKTLLMFSFTRSDGAIRKLFSKIEKYIYSFVLAPLYNNNFNELHLHIFNECNCDVENGELDDFNTFSTGE